MAMLDQDFGITWYLKQQNGILVGGFPEWVVYMLTTINGHP